MFIETDKKAKGGKYDVKYTTFPSDLFGAPEKYGNCWMMININMLKSSLTKYGYSDKTVDLEDWERKRFTYLDARVQSGQNSSAEAIVGTAAGVGALAGAKSLLKTIVSDTPGNKAIAIGAAAAKTVAGVATAAIPFTPLLTDNKRETKRIVSAIQLPMPNELQFGYSAKWSQGDTALFDAASRMGKQFTDFITGSGNGNPSTMVQTGGDAAQALGLSMNNIFGAAGVTAASGLAANPKSEQIFEGVNFRTFNLTYMFYPKSLQEYNSFKEIISLLKFHMHPDYKSEGRYTFVYPSEFDITFYQNGMENRQIARIATCVLTDLSVNYTPQGAWVAHSAGSPNMIQVSMAFRELSILTKENMAESADVSAFGEDPDMKRYEEMFKKGGF